jgi:hypothetical protein
MTCNEKPGSQRRKKRRLTQSKDLSSERLWVSIGENLDILSRAQENHQRITTTIVDKIETQNRELISALRVLLDSQKCRVLEGFKDTDNQIHALVEDLQAQQCCLVEEGVKGTEQRIRPLVVDLVEDMLAQQCRVIAVKRSIEQYRVGKEDD